jgi:glycine/D-amino acid oxidase-like deaminating enzyme
METTEVLIVGQGLAGSWLSWWLEQEKISYRIIDSGNAGGASVHAAGLINPVTGRRLVKTWMIEELMPFAWDAYRNMGSFLGAELITEIAVIDFFPSVQMLQSFQKRYTEDALYLEPGEKTALYDTWFRYDLGWGSIRPCYLVQTEKMLTGWRNHLRAKGYLQEAPFDPAKLILRESALEYEGLHALHLIFCDGKVSAGNPYFERLPFALNKGEGLLVEIADLPQNAVFKKGLSIIPWKENIFWVGSSYEWEFQDARPSEAFLRTTESWLKHFLKIPFRILDHFAAIRPATLERRPFAGFHPKYPQIGLLNGLGTKGCSLAPWFAKQLVAKMTGKGILDPLADIKRFEKILMK